MKFKGQTASLLLAILILLIPIVQSLTFEQKTNTVTQTITNVTYYYVDNNLSDVDSSRDKGTHSNFTAQQYGPDSISDNLSEGSAEDGNWLSGWQKRIKIEVDHNDIIDTLNNFPVLVYLSNSSGRNNDDVSGVFDELQSDANRKKLAVTTSDGIAQCYVEVEKWNDSNEQAWLWVKVPSVNSTANTDLYLYYDSDHAGNTDYVGDPGSTPAENVWDSNYVLVQHLHETSGIHNDSTSYGYDGTPSSNLDQGISAKIDGGDYFNGTSGEADCINWTGSDFNFDYDDSFTFDFWMKSDTGGNKFLFAKGHSNWGYRLQFQGDGDLDFHMKVNGASRQIRRRVDALVEDDGWHHVAVTYNGSRDVSGLTIYADSVIPTTQAEANNIQAGDSMQTDLVYYIGRNSGGTAYWYEGYIDEFHISNTTRSTAWIKASYESGRDNLLDFGSEESLTYELDLEVQWTNVDYNEANEELCVYGRSMSAEDIRVDAWNGSGWENLLSDLSLGWNNVTVTSYFTSSTFTIRFKGVTETSDTTQDSWEIDSTLLHVWS